MDTFTSPTFDACAALAAMINSSEPLVRSGLQAQALTTPKGLGLEVRIGLLGTRVAQVRWNAAEERWYIEARAIGGTRPTSGATPLVNVESLVGLAAQMGRFAVQELLAVAQAAVDAGLQWQPVPCEPTVSTKDACYAAPVAVG